jgi:hypothetical protein
MIFRAVARSVVILAAIMTFSTLSYALRVQARADEYCSNWG